MELLSNIDILKEISKHLNHEDVINLSMTNKYMRTNIVSYSKYLLSSSKEYTIKFPCGSQLTLLFDKLHSFNDQPSMIQSNGTKLWHKNGKLHRIGNPAMEFESEYKTYYCKSLIHNSDSYAHYNKILQYYYIFNTCVPEKGFRVLQKYKSLIKELENEEDIICALSTYKYKIIKDTLEYYDSFELD